jgi:hypothetical protein
VQAGFPAFVFFAQEASRKNSKQEAGNDEMSVAQKPGRTLPVY